MDREMVSFVSIGLFVLANFLIIFARNKLNGIWRGIVSTIAFLMVIPAIFLGFIIVMGIGK